MENIRLNFAFLCDSAFLSEGDKLNIVGIFKNINGILLPIQHPQMFIVTNISIKKEGNYKEQIKIVYSVDKKEIITPLEFNFSAKGIGEKEFGVLTRLNNIKFDRAGLYKIQIFINDTMLKELPLTINISNYAKK